MSVGRWRSFNGGMLESIGSGLGWVRIKEGSELFTGPP
jgi:hypothetical protein